MAWQQHRGLGESGPGMFDTSYRTSYASHGGGFKGRQPRKPKHRWTEPMPFTATTTAGSDYVRWEDVRPASPIRPSRGSLLPDENRSFVSEARGSYDPKPIKMRKPIKRATTRANSQPFIADTTNRSDYQNWEKARASTPQLPDNRRMFVPETRDFVSEARVSYNGAGARPAKSMAPVQRTIKTLPFEGMSTHAADYPRWDARPATAFRPKHERNMEDEARNFVSEARAQYEHKQTAPAQLLRPQRRPTQNLPFEAKSTAHNDYRNWEDARASTPCIPNRNPDFPAEDRQFKSESRAAYNLKPMQKTRSTKKLKKWVNQQDDRTFTSEARGALQHWADYEPTQSYKPANSSLEYHPFNGTTTHQNDYTGKSAPRMSNFAPQQKRSTLRDTRDFYSEARSSYQGKRGTPTKSLKPAFGMNGNIIQHPY